MKKGYKYEDLEGKKFGIINVIKQVDNGKKGRYWLCECSICGYQREMSTAQLTYGKFEKCICKKFQGNTYEFDFENKIVKVFFSGQNNYFICDIDDFEKIKLYTWGLDKRGYVTNSKFKLHRFLMDVLDPKIIIDHIDGNPLNNKKSNLRICKQQENSCNKSINKNNTSGVIGVRWNKRVNKWVADIKVNYKKIHLGYYDTIEEATKVRRDAELKYFGEYSIQKSRNGDYSNKNKLMKK